MERSQTPKILRLSTGLYVCLLTSALLNYILSLFLFIFYIALEGLKCDPFTQFWHAMHANYTWGLLLQKFNITFFRASCPLHMCNLSICTFCSPLYASIWLKFWASWVAWLLCLCPTFPLIWLGHKGSTSAIITAGSAGCVPQTGWSRKLAFLREYSVGEQKMTF